MRAYLSWLITAPLSRNRERQQPRDVVRLHCGTLRCTRDIRMARRRSQAHARASYSESSPTAAARELERTRRGHAIQLAAFMISRPLGTHVGLDLWHDRTADGRSDRQGGLHGPFPPATEWTFDQITTSARARSPICSAARCHGRDRDTSRSREYRRRRPEADSYDALTSRASQCVWRR